MIIALDALMILIVSIIVFAWTAVEIDVWLRKRKRRHWPKDGHGHTYFGDSKRVP